MSVTVLLFAGLADRAGTRRVDLPFEPGDTVQAVRDRLIGCIPALQPYLPTLLYAVNEEYARLADPVRPGDTVALIPPVSGGC